MLSHSSHLYEALTARETVKLWCDLLGRPASRADIAQLVHDVRLRFDVLAPHARFLVQGQYGCIRQDQMRLDAGDGDQQLQQPQAIHGARGTRDGHDDTARPLLLAIRHRAGTSVRPIQTFHS